MRFQETARLEVKSLGRGSNIGSFYKLSVEERLRIVQEFSGLSDEEVHTLKTGALPVPSAQRMIENVVGVLPVPLGIAVNFLVNDKDYLVPMAIEESSVVAAASHAAKIARGKGGFKTSSTEPIMIGQIQLVKCPSPRNAEKQILSSKTEILSKANQQDPTLVSKGGGAKDLRVRILPSLAGTMVIAELLVDCRDAMGANVVNTMAEAVAPMLEELSGGNANLRIISNLVDKRIARATAHFSREDLGGEDVVDGITAVHPAAKISLKILGVKTAKELGEVMAAVGLAQNLAALRALAAEGIQRGHMSLHARNIAAMAGAEGDMIDAVAAAMVDEKKVRLDRAKELIAEMASSKSRDASHKEAHQAKKHPN